MRVAEVARQVRDLGLAPSDAVLVHASFRAVRPVEGGPAGLIDALTQALGPAGTLLLPGWTGDDDTVFDPATTAADPALGRAARNVLEAARRAALAPPDGFCRAWAARGRVRRGFDGPAAERAGKRGRPALIFLCDAAEGCGECDEARASVLGGQVPAPSGTEMRQA